VLYPLSYGDVARIVADSNRRLLDLDRA
jgi:hypothetical protein